VLNRWDGNIWGTEKQPRFTVVLKHPAALRAMFCSPSELSLGEAYIHDDFEIEGDIEAAERRPVAGTFALRADGEVSFKLGAYDSRQPLVIDPGITFASFLGGAGSDNGGGVQVDTTTNPNAPKMYVPGITSDITTFPEPSTLIGTAPGGTF